MTTVAKSWKVHYGWWGIVANGALVLFASLGLARFAYTMLLPAMQTGLGFPYDEMGFIGTANFIGYLVAVLLSPAVIRLLRPRSAIAWALLVIALGMLGISCAHRFFIIAFLYTIVGLGSGLASISMMILVTYWFHSKQRGKAAGLLIAGNGMGIIFAGFLIPLLNRSYGANGWRSGWLVLALISLAIAASAAGLLRNQPSELALDPVGQPATGSSEQVSAPNGNDSKWILLRLGALYMIFGVTFMVYGTFIVSTMINEYGFSEQKAGLYWSWVGFFSLFSGVGFGTLSDYIGRKYGLVLVFAVQTMAYLLAGLKLGSLGLIISIALYGSAIFAIPAIMTAAIGDYLSHSRAATAFATITIFFAVGQAIGPGGAGLIANAANGFTTAYLVASFLTASAAIFAATLPAAICTSK